MTSCGGGKEAVRIEYSCTVAVRKCMSRVDHSIVTLTSREGRNIQEAFSSLPPYESLPEDILAI
jgi:hypothetical protein